MSSLSSLYARLREKQEELRRMLQCQSSLQSCRQEFLSHEYMCLQPELSSITWHGNLARNFEDLRESRMHRSYQNIENEQFESTLQAVETKIEQLEAEIAALEAAIAAMEQAESEKDS